MSFQLSNKLRVLILVVLIVIIIAGAVVIWVNAPRYSPLEISLPPPKTPLTSQIYIDGEVSNPGLYNLKPGDTINTLLQAAGGSTADSGLAQLTLNISGSVSNQSPQKIDINRAENWLLEALPGIGEVLAQRIIDYRQQNGPFRNVSELASVKGITVTTYEQIKNLVTVAE